MPRPCLAGWWRGRGPAGVVLSGGASGFVALLGYRAKALSGSGAAAAALLGTAVLSQGGLSPSAVLLSFFLSSSGLSHWRRDQKRGGAQVVKGACRDAGQVLANGAVATFAVLLGAHRPTPVSRAAFMGAVATANADTWSTEIGAAMAGRPRMLTTLAPVTPGTSGAVSLPGLVAAMGGAAWVGATAWLVGPSPPHRRGETLRSLISLALVSGVGGALLDSFLGATIQGRFYCDACGVATETRTHQCGAVTRHVSGLRWIDNDMVNFISSLAGAVVAAARVRGGTTLLSAGTPTTGMGGGRCAP